MPICRVARAWVLCVATSGAKCVASLNGRRQRKKRKLRGKRGAVCLSRPSRRDAKRMCIRTIVGRGVANFSAWAGNVFREDFCILTVLRRTAGGGRGGREMQRRNCGLGVAELQRGLSGAAECLQTFRARIVHAAKDIARARTWTVCRPVCVRGLNVSAESRRK